MSDFDLAFQATIGGSPCTGLCLTDYSKSADGIFDSQGSRTGTKYDFQCKGEVSAEDVPAMAAALAAFEAWASQDGADFAVVAGESTLEEIDAGDCDGDVHVKFSYGSDRGPTYQEVAFTVTATRRDDAVGGTSGLVSETEKVSKKVNVEGLAVITRSGNVTTTGAYSATDLALGKIGVCPACYQLEYGYDTDELDHNCAYTITLTQLVADYPASDGGGILDGERTYSWAYDEHNRKVSTYSYDYAGPGAQHYVEDMHESLRGAGGLMRASISVTGHKTRRATGQFDVLESRDGGTVLELVETISHARTGPLLKEMRYPGVAPVILMDEQSCYVYEQSGRAVGLGVYPDAPEYAFDADGLMEGPEFVLCGRNDNEFEVSWRYRFIFTEAQGIQLPSTRSDSSGSFDS